MRVAEGEVVIVGVRLIPVMCTDERYISLYNLSHAWRREFTILDGEVLAPVAYLQE